MPDRSIFLYADQARGRGWVGIQVEGLDFSTGKVQARFTNWGHKQPYLSTRGWQVAETWCEVQAVAGASGTVDVILLPPEITGLLRQGSNYRLAIRADGVTKLDMPIRWGGIATNNARVRTASDALAPASVAQPVEHAAGAPAPVVPDAGAPGLADLAPENVPALPTQPLVPEPIGQAGNDNEIDADAAAWAATVAAGCQRSYETYLRQQPEGAFAGEAREALAYFLPSRILVRSSFSNTNLLGPAYGLDVCVFMLSEQRKVRVDRDFVCSFAVEDGTGVSLAQSACGSIAHLGKKKASGRDLASESVSIDLAAIPDNIRSIALTVSLDPNAPAHVGLDMIGFAVVDVFDDTASTCLFSIDFKQGRHGIKGKLIAELVRRGDGWKILDCEQPFREGLDAICAFFGVAVQ